MTLRSAGRSNPSTIFAVNNFIRFARNAKRLSLTYFLSMKAMATDKGDFMTDKLKEIIENAPVKKKGTFAALMFIPNGECNGFWGHYGYDNILLLGREGGTWYKIATSANVFLMEHYSMFSIDIPTELVVPVLFSPEGIEIDNSLEPTSVLAKKKTELPLM